MTKKINIDPPNNEGNNTHTVTISLSDQVNNPVISNFAAHIFNNPPVYNPNFIPD